jgi:hypothetical protein
VQWNIAFAKNALLRCSISFNIASGKVKLVPNMGIGSIEKGSLVGSRVGCLLVGYLLGVLVVVVVDAAAAAAVVRKFSHCTVPGSAWSCTRS